MSREERLSRLKRALEERIVVLDGAMGTLIQSKGVEEADFRGERFKDWPQDLKGNNDLLVLTRPDLIRDIHIEFAEAGADVLSTNTFNATALPQSDYGTQDLAFEINKAAATLAREAAERCPLPDGPRFVAGALGPMNKTLSISPDVNDPGFREVTFDQVREAYREAVKGLVEGGVDILLVETVFDTLNAKAALFAIEEHFAETGERLPVSISGTITDRSGRTLSGQTPEAFWNSLRHVRPFSMGLNCALGAEEMRPHIVELARLCDTLVAAYPNAGLPNEFGEYDETPEMMAAHLGAWADEGLLNLVGGCCGTRPSHIKAIKERVEGVAPRKVPEPEVRMRLSGLEAFTL